MKFGFLIIAAWFFALSSSSIAAAQFKVAVLDRSDARSEFVEKLITKLALDPNLRLLDADSVNAASAPVLKNENPFNLPIETAKILGTAIDCDYLLIIKNDAVQRSSFARPIYFEANAVIFAVSARTGKLIWWRDAFYEADKMTAARQLRERDLPNVIAQLTEKITINAAQERREIAQSSSSVNEIPALPDDAAEDKDLRIPLPFKRLRPDYPAAARRLQIAATVDVTAEIDERGEVVTASIARWAGFDLDEAAIETVKKLHFRPALRDGQPFAVKVLLRYNFRDLNRNQ